MMSVLVISNNTFNINHTAKLLQREGYQVFTAQNGHDALRLTEYTPVDLVLLDTATQGDDGLDRHLESQCNASIIQWPVPGAYGLELGLHPRIVTALQEADLLKQIRTTLQARPHPAHQPSLVETLNHKFARWIRELAQSFTAPSKPRLTTPSRPSQAQKIQKTQPTRPKSRPSHSATPARQAAISVAGTTLPQPQSVLAGLITLNPTVTAWIYLGLLAVAEICTFIVQPQVGLVLHGIVLMLLLINAAFRWQEPAHHLLLGLTFVPLIRILSLSLPMINLPRIYWYFIIAIPLLLVAAMMIRLLRFSWSEVGINFRQIPFQLMVGLTGFIFGYVYYLILKPLPLINNLVWPDIIIPALIIFIGTGFTEELIFRGILQRAATEFMGVSGINYIAALYTLLHIGHRDPLNPVGAFILSIFLGWVVYKTRSLLGAVICHGITNVMLFLIMPFLV